MLTNWKVRHLYDNIEWNLFPGINILGVYLSGEHWGLSMWSICTSVSKYCMHVWVREKMIKKEYEINRQTLVSGHWVFLKKEFMTKSIVGVLWNVTGQYCTLGSTLPLPHTFPALVLWRTRAFTHTVTHTLCLVYKVQVYPAFYNYVG